ncbi:hypothetical protein BO85DRAFT_444210 [Aspergillus piperis CBS 112811]|uniref:Uncharacterized protein n=1 Tax=Aspergillus piperis CBS 112811 TaxID=1448313 RepID=A0A8G1RB22_9EURO|nr:hypothetical protein BO85DRAFT_444210 [Aspergillus piperis CBS 112811]RAH62874.1 hypothetical protein BO85DRAFT_444210 [Aspergillus piperis CBS 112811]
MSCVTLSLSLFSSPLLCLDWGIILSMPRVALPFSLPSPSPSPCLFCCVCVFLFAVASCRFIFYWLGLGVVSAAWHGMAWLSVELYV